MPKVKLFRGAIPKGDENDPLYKGNIQKQINTWLAENPDVDIQDIRLSSDISSGELTAVVLILYSTQGAYPASLDDDNYDSAYED